VSRELVAIHDGGAVAAVLHERAGRASLRYDETWRRSEHALALSLSLPLTAASHGPSAVEPWLWGLLPDNPLVLERWGKDFHVSSRNAFRLLEHVGEDCSGAFQLVRGERAREWERVGGDVAWLTPKQIEARLRDVRADPSRTRTAADAGQFSLAGAQPKIALYRDGERWGVPSGRTPTTHVLKPRTGDLEGLVENEHYCLSLAAAVGLPVARSEVCRFGKETCIVSTRFDRAWTATLATRAAATAAEESASAAPGSAARAARAAAQASALAELARSRPIVRLHQEDLCQALAVHPTRKYQNEGGPGAKAIVSLLFTAGSAAREDVRTFVDALAFAWITAGTDAHAKNFAMLHAARGSVRLAPLYDLASALPYPHLDPRRLKLAMSIGGEYRMEYVHARHFEKLEVDAGPLREPLVARARALAERVEALAPAVATEVRRAGVRHPILAKLSSAIQARAAACVRRLAR
jgi:serine/threonine-protein kinase HipA